MRSFWDLESTADAAAFEVKEAARLIFPGPRHGGPRLAELREILRPKGRVAFSGTAARIFADVDPESAAAPAAPLIALDTIARSDAAGLERMLLSVLPHVDEIVLGIDMRSDEETHVVARAYADTYWTFDAAALGLSETDWAGNKIDFAAARNLGRDRVKASWVLVVDADEFLAVDIGADLRALVRSFKSGITAAHVRVKVGDFEQECRQRLARREGRWWSATHNQLRVAGDSFGLVPGIAIVHDTGLRSTREQQRRLDQRQEGVKQLEEEAAKGNLIALFHLAKHKLAEDDDVGIKLVQEYRFKAEPHGPCVEERMWLAVAVAFHYYDKDDFVEAELWALRAMLDGPCMEALCLLGDIAEDQGDLERALHWYEAACVIPENKRLRFRGFTDLRWGRRDGLRRELADRAAEPVVAPTAGFTYERLYDLPGAGSRASLTVARQVSSDGAQRTVVVKRADLASRTEILRELRISRSLGHPNIAQALDGGVDGSSCFLAVEHVDGLDLLTLSYQRPLPWELGVYIVREVCAGLAHVHSVRILHCDVSPRNVLVGANGDVKLTDFGAARVASERAVGVVRGATAFMAPEHARGEMLDEHADVYGAGALLYLIVTGRRPHEADTDVDLLLAAQRGRVAPIERSDLPAGLVDVIQAAMHPDRRARYPSARAFARALEPFASADRSALVAWLKTLLPAAAE